MPTQKTFKHKSRNFETKNVTHPVFKPMTETVSKPKKNLFPIVLIVLITLSLSGYFIFGNKQNDNDKTPELVETPPEVNKFNSLAISKRPYIEIIQNTQGTCGGIDINISNLKNGEQRSEFEVEYTHINEETGTKMIEGMFAEREFGQEKKHDPMLFGTCSGSKCRCHDDIISGTLKFHFYGKENYSLKGDYVVHKLENENTEFSSLDGRLTLDVSNSLSSKETILITSTFGLPEELEKAVLKGPYGIFVEGMPELDKPIKATFQGQDVVNGQIQFWNGKTWQALEATIEGDKATFELPKLGVIVLTEK